MDLQSLFPQFHDAFLEGYNSIEFTSLSSECFDKMGDYRNCRIKLGGEACGRLYASTQICFIKKYAPSISPHLEECCKKKNPSECGVDLQWKNTLKVIEERTSFEGMSNIGKEAFEEVEKSIRMPTIDHLASVCCPELHKKAFQCMKSNRSDFRVKCSSQIRELFFFVGAFKSKMSALSVHKLIKDQGDFLEHLMHSNL